MFTYNQLIENSVEKTLEKNYLRIAQSNINEYPLLTYCTGASLFDRVRIHLRLFGGYPFHGTIGNSLFFDVHGISVNVLAEIELIHINLCTENRIKSKLLRI